MKKILSSVLSIGLGLGLMAGCTPETDGDTADGTEDTGTTSTELTISTGEEAPEYTETLTTDVLVLGGGGAGISSALVAAENGSEVIIVEKFGYLGGATLLSAGIIPASGTPQQEEAGIVDSEDLFARDIFRPSSYSVRKDLVYTITENASETINWLEEQGVTMNLVTDSLYYGQSNYRMHIAEDGGPGLTNTLIDNLKANDKIELLDNSPATELAVKNGEVVGAFVERDNEEVIFIEAENTILATSGFAANEEMLAEYIPEMVNAHPYVAPGATGEGIIWGANLGAELANMKAYQGHGVFSEELGGSVDLSVLYRGGILVNEEGQRFTNEHIGYSELAPEVLAQTGNHAYMVFNQENADNTGRFEEFDEAGIVMKADTIEDLANELDVDLETLQASVADYESGIETGQDSLNRTLFPENFNGPFYAIDVTGDLRHTQGGLVTDVVGHVLKADGTLIKGLYAAGGVMEGFSDTAGPGYMSGNGLLQAFVFGRLAGENAATTARSEASVITKDFE